MNFIRKPWCYLVDDNFRAMLFFSLFAILPLLAVYILEYFFAVEPCKLCIYQRIPLFIIAALPIFFINQAVRKYSIAGLFIVMIAILVNVALSFYHLGIENKWFVNSLCTGFNGSKTAMEKFFLSSQTLFHNCAEVKFRFLGLSLAAWNFMYCLMFFIAVNFIIVRYFFNRKDDSKR